MTIGANARDRITRSGEPVLSTAISPHTKEWAFQDANLLHTPHIPLLAICSAMAHESAVSVVTRLTDKMHSFAGFVIPSQFFTDTEM